jgi:hypothetical protein
MSWAAGHGLAEPCTGLADSILVDLRPPLIRRRCGTGLQPGVTDKNAIERIREDLFIELFSGYSANFGESQWAPVVKCVEDSGHVLVDLFLRKDWGAPRMPDSISIFLVSPPLHTDRPVVDPKKPPNQAGRHTGMMFIAQDSACMDALLSDGWARERASPARRIWASLASRISRIGVTKAREGVAIGRNGIVNGGLPFKIVNNREIEIQCRETIQGRTTTDHDACPSNSECMDKYKIFIYREQIKSFGFF